MEPRAQSGFSLIETVIAIGVLVFVLGAIVSSVYVFYRSNAHALGQAYAINSARKGVEYMVRDIREAAFSDEGAYPIVTIAENEFLFYSDIDDDIFIEKVRYFIDGTTLKKGVIDSSGDPLTYDDGDEVITQVSDNVRNSEESVAVFSYYNASGTPVVSSADATSIVFVTMRLVVDVDPQNPPESFMLQSSATLRNVRVNQ